MRVGVSFLPESLPRVSSIGLDWEVISFALGITVLTGFVCGLLPAYAASRTGVNDALKEGGRTGSAGGGHARLRSILVVGQLVVALVLLTGSGLLLRSFDKLRKVDLGFRADHLLTASFGLPHQQYSTQASVDSFDAALLSKLRQLPGVEAAGITDQLPAAGQENYGAIVAEGYVSPKGATLTAAWRGQAMGQYFSAMGIPLLRGRDLTDADTASSPMVVIVNRKFAQHYWPGQDPIGKRIHIGLQETTLPWMTVVGEIGDIKQKSADSDVTEQIYQPMSQFKRGLGQFAPPDMLTGSGGSIALRSSMAPEQMAGSLRAVVRSIDPQLPLTACRVDGPDRCGGPGFAPLQHRDHLQLCRCCRAAFSAWHLQRDCLLCRAAQPRDGHPPCARVAARQCDAPGSRFRRKAWVCSDAASGDRQPVFATRLMRSMLFQVDPLDPTVIVLAAISIFLLALAASVIPARRAASVEPMQALRAE